MAEIAVIGAGPTGLSCALFLAKAGRKVVVVDSGQTIIRRANLRNYLGFPDGLPGYELIERGKAQIETFGGAVVKGRPVDVRETDKGFLITVAGEEVKAVQLVLATGMSVLVAEAIGIPVVRGIHANRIVETDALGHTVKKGVWAAGVLAGTPVQAIIGAGDGARVAVNVLSEIRGSVYIDHDILPSTKRATVVGPSG